MKLKYSALYILLIVLVNYAFSAVPLVKLPDGTMWPPISLVVGFVFVTRDFAQREIGHKVLGAMLIGTGISYFMASPAIALASAGAFLVSELADWAVYTFTRRPLSQRVLFSSALGAPIDSIVFLGGVGILSGAGVAAMTASKMLGAFVLWWMLRRREQLAAG